MYVMGRKPVAANQERCKENSLKFVTHHTLTEPKQDNAWTGSCTKAAWIKVHRSCRSVGRYCSTFKEPNSLINGVWVEIWATIVSGNSSLIKVLSLSHCGPTFRGVFEKSASGQSMVPVKTIGLKAEWRWKQIILTGTVEMPVYFR